MFLAALVILTDSFAIFGLSDLGLSLIMLLLNLVIVVLALYWCFKRHQLELEQQQWRSILTQREADIINQVMLRDSTHRGDYDYDDDDDDANQHSLAVAAASAAASEGTTAQSTNEHARHEHRKRNEEILRQFLISADDVHIEKKVGSGGEFMSAKGETPPSLCVAFS